MQLQIRSVTTALFFAFFVLGPATPADAQSKCSANKMKAAGKKTVAKLVCHAKAVGKGDPVDAACLVKAEDKFNTAFTKAESKGDCLTTGDTAAIEAQVDALVDDVASDLGGPGPSKCTKAKLQASGKKAAAKSNCHGKSIAKNIDVDAGCLAKAEDKFVTAFTKAEAKGDCIAATGDAAAIEAKIDAFITDLRTALVPCHFDGAECTGECAGGDFCGNLGPGPDNCGCFILCHLDGPTFTCAGECPFGSLCGNFQEPGNCICFPASLACGPTVCGGGCPGPDANTTCELNLVSGMCECVTP